ncbi:MAG: hypothetical protein KKC01_09870 [Gammaproteobacteria bacterium]|nr:hypothetical protein [Gammaproteobacteria bacterium]
MKNKTILAYCCLVILTIIPGITAASDNIALYELVGSSGSDATYERIWSGHINNIENEPLLPGDIVLAPPSTGGGGGGGGGGNCIPTPHDPCEHTQAPIIGDGGGEGIRSGVAGNWEIIWFVNGGAGGGGGGSGGGGGGSLSLPPITVIGFAPPSFPSPSQFLRMWIGTRPGGSPGGGEPGVIGRPISSGVGAAPGLPVPELDEDDPRSALCSDTSLARIDHANRAFGLEQSRRMSTCGLNCAIRTGTVVSIRFTGGGSESHTVINMFSTSPLSPVPGSLVCD